MRALKYTDVRIVAATATPIRTKVLQKHQPETLRFLLLNTHYRSPIEYSDKRLEELRRSLDGFYRFFERYQRITNKSFYDLSAPTRQAPFEAGKGELKLTATDLDEIETASAAITVQGARYPEAMERLIDR